MGIFLGIVVLLVTIGWCAVVWFANSMSDAPGRPAEPVWPWFVGGCALSAMFFIAHFVGW